MLHLLLLGALLVASACADADRSGVVVTDSAGIELVRVTHLPGVLEEGAQWTAVPEWELRTARDDLDVPVVFQPADILPLGDTAVVVLDGRGDEVVVVLTRSGSVSGRFGRRGRGPGELWGPFTLTTGRAGEIRILDRGNSKLISFGLDGTLLDERRIQVEGGAGKAAALHDGRIMLQTSFWRDRELRFGISEVSPEGELIPRADLPSPPGAPGRIQRGRPLWTTLRDAVVVTRSDLPVFSILSGDGELERRISLPLTTRRLTEANIEEQIRTHGPIARSLEPGTIALTNELYAFGDTIFGTYQSNLWRAEEDAEIPGDTRIWRLVTRHGRPAGSFEVPKDFTPMRSVDGSLWGARLDSSGVPVLQRLRLVPPPSD